MDDSYYMKMALELSVRGTGYTSPNPLVGAVVVKDGDVVGKGWHEYCGGPHAEVNAIDDAGESALGATIYVTLEPCNHTGKTPPCTEKILAAGITRVVIAMRDPNPGVMGGGMDYLLEKGLDVTAGVCEDEALRINEIFSKYIKTKRPFVVVKCASTLDGRIATSTGHSKWVTGPDSRGFVHEIRQRIDAILVGIDTVRADDPSLTTRMENLKTRDPRRIILDTKLSIDEKARVLNVESDADTIIVTGPEIPEDKAERIRALGAVIVKAPLTGGVIDLSALMDILGEMEITSVLIEGGSRIIGSAFAGKIVDKVYFFFAPKVLGGDDGVPVAAGKGALRMEDCVDIANIRVERFGDDVMIEGDVL